MEEVSNALRHVFHARDTENQWKRAVNALREMTQLQRAKAWQLFSDDNRKLEPNASFISHSQYKTLFKNAVREATGLSRILCVCRETEESDNRKLEFSGKYRPTNGDGHDQIELIRKCNQTIRECMLWLSFYKPDKKKLSELSENMNDPDHGGSHTKTSNEDYSEAMGMRETVNSEFQDEIQQLQQTLMDQMHIITEKLHERGNMQALVRMIIQFIKAQQDSLQNNTQAIAGLVEVTKSQSQDQKALTDMLVINQDGLIKCTEGIKEIISARPLADDSQHAKEQLEKLESLVGTFEQKLEDTEVYKRRYSESFNKLLDECKDVSERLDECLDHQDEIEERLKIISEHIDKETEAATVTTATTSSGAKVRAVSIRPGNTVDESPNAGLKTLRRRKDRYDIRKDSPYSENLSKPGTLAKPLKKK